MKIYLIFPFFLFPGKNKCVTFYEAQPSSDKLIYMYQGGITCGVIDEPRKSSKAIDEHVIINFCDKNVAIARFRDKNGGFILFTYICISCRTSDFGR